MDGLQQQINELNQKVTQLHHIVEQLGQKMGASRLPREVMVNNPQPSLPTLSGPNPMALPRHGYYQSVMEHKDILPDESENSTLIAPEVEPLLTTDLQVRRLTAQLTAAYNRIAALEEQLLASRIMR
ncbi:hypothetical protein [Crocosphaera sp. XPORK-15E]|uniref:hypothetical protein n=1 Tax=Crocosphaera sp. XPORK-15E TaxID=3110247 RepID=UPI002B1FB434|nr:hypothetical protein [Crocosphaera sp. XPORK-15E]MEA5532908.1 hypothetical protein [Crocosphaera sp. XPORK-15E]